MKNVTLLVLLLIMTNVLAPAQTLKKHERKARKTFKKEAYGMALYHSEAVLKIDSTHEEAIQWSTISREVLHLNKTPAELAQMHIVAIPFADVFEELVEKETANSASFTTLVVNTLNAVDSSALNQTYIGITNDGFGQGYFVQNDASTNMAIFPLPRNHFFTITGTKNGFSSGTSTLSTRDVSEGDTLFCELYLTPSWGMPISVYFDFENPRALDPSDSTTNLSYEETWVDYLYKINEYIDSNSISDSLVHRATAQKEVGSFFIHSVDASYDKLESVCHLLEDYLRAGYKVVLTMEGHAGPYESGNDPRALINRRLHSIENFFSFYRAGIFQPWLANGNLKIERQVVERPRSVPPPKAKNAFALEAAKARKVVLKMVEVTEIK